MSARKILSGVTMVALSVGCLAADAASSCSPAFSEVDVKNGLKVQVDCGLPGQTLNRLTIQLNRVVKGAKLSDAQTVSLASATNVILGVAYAQSGRVGRKTDTAFANVEPLVERLAGQIRAQPDAALAAETRQWAARYENLLRRSSIARSPDPLELHIDEALARFDLESASQLLPQLLAEQQGTPQVFAARCYQAGEIELLRF